MKLSNNIFWFMDVFFAYIPPGVFLVALCYITQYNLPWEYFKYSFHQQKYIF